MPLTRFGFHFANTSYQDVGSADFFARIADIAEAAEQAGFDSVWVPDHVHQNNFNGGPDEPMPEAYTLLGALACRTEHVKLGACVSPVTFRNPGLLAKMVTTLDVISGGRAVLGIGAGWDVDEHAAYGIPFLTMRERFDRLAEAIEVCQKLFSEEQVDYQGTYYELKGARNLPRPVQARIPTLVAGTGEKRTLPIVAKYADACNVEGEPEEVVHKLGVLRQHCENIGRDYAEITTTTQLKLPDGDDELAQLAASLLETGVDALILMSPPGGVSPATVTAWGKELQRVGGS